MNIILAIIIILVILGADYFTYKKICEKLPREIAVQEKKDNKPEEHLEDKVTNAERLYLEGIQNVLSFDIDTMKRHMRGDDED